ncbi:MAG: hypothetical protein ACTHU0_25800 [Kofleriaceae bacterium]
MPKPSTLPTWATTDNYPVGVESHSGTPTKSVPDTGRLAVGIEPKEKFYAQDFNWLLYWLCLWAKYVNDGQIEGDLAIDGDLHVTGDTTLDGTLDATGDTSFASDVEVTGTVVTGADYAHTADFARTLPVVNSSASLGMGMSSGVPDKIAASSTIWHYYSPSFGVVGIRQGDRVKKVRVAFSNNTSNVSVNVEVTHRRFDIGLGGTTGSSTATQGVIEVVPTNARNTIEIHDGMLDVMWVYVTGSAAGIVVESIDVYWDHPLAP